MKEYKKISTIMKRVQPALSRGS